MLELRDVYIAAIKATIEYIIEDVDDTQLCSMLSMLSTQAERTAHTRRERALEAEAEREHMAFRQANLTSVSHTTGAQRHG